MNTTSSSASKSILAAAITTRRTGTGKLKIKETGRRYLSISFYLWLEKYFSKGDYWRATAQKAGDA